MNDGASAGSARGPARRRGSSTRRRIAWTGADQVLSTATNFALNVVVARSVAPDVFGAFSLAYVTYLFWRGLTWAVCAEPFIIRHGGASEDDRERAIRAMLGAAAGLGCGAGLVSLAVATPLGGPVGGALAALAAVLPALLVQEAVRSTYLGSGRPQHAALNDAVWGIAQLVGVAVLVQAGHDGAPELLLAWGASAAVAALVGLVHLHVLPNPLRLPGWVRDHRSLGPWLAMEFVLTRGSSQVTFYALGWVASLGAVASLRAAQVVVGPLSVLFSAAQVSMVSEGVRLAAVSTQRLMRGVVLGTIAVAAASVAYGVALVLLPDGVGEELVGAVWSDTRPLLPIMAAAVVARAVTVGAAAGSRSLGEAKQLLATRAVIAPLSIGSGVVGAAAFGAAGAAASFVVTAALSAALYWRQFLQQARAMSTGGQP